MDDENLRKIGARHSLGMVLVWVRQHIGAIDGQYAPRIDPRHRRKRAARDAVLRPLKELEARIAGQHAELRDVASSSASSRKEKL